MDQPGSIDVTISITDGWPANHDDSNEKPTLCQSPFSLFFFLIFDLIILSVNNFLFLSLLFSLKDLNVDRKKKSKTGIKKKNVYIIFNCLRHFGGCAWIVIYFMPLSITFFISFKFVLASCHKGQNKNYFVHDLQKGFMLECF